MSTAGYVYLIRSDSGHYKIGKAVDPNRRATQFTLQLPFKIEVICAIRNANHHEAERFLHRAFNQFHVNGEWFLLPPLAVLYFQYLARIMEDAIGPDEWDFVEGWSQTTFDEITRHDLDNPARIREWMRCLLVAEKSVTEPGGEHEPTGF